MVKKGYTNPVIKLQKKDIIQLIECALKEDEADEDITTFSIFNIPEEAHAEIILKSENAVISGTDLIRWTFEEVDENVKVIIHKKDGRAARKKDTIVSIYGNIQSILRGERIALNFLGAMSGIATQTSKIVHKLRKWSIVPIDTRKTLPGFRRLSKYSVIQGGGKNHRISLGDMGLIKENHIVHTKGVKEAIKKFRSAYTNKTLEVEIETIDQLKEALEEKPNYILLDNMSPELLRECTAMIKKFNKENQCKIYSEASGGYNYENIDQLKGTQVDFVSIGSMTSNIIPIDFSLLVRER